MDNINDRTWVERINTLLDEQQKSKKDLAAGIKSAPSTISAWLSEETRQEPKIIGFHAAAEYFGVSMDYLFGADECKTPDNNEIHKQTGLTDRAISNLKQAQRNASAGSVEDEKKIYICNHLLESIHETPFFEDLYNYLFGEFSFEDKTNKELQWGTRVISKSPSGQESREIFFSSAYSHAFLSMVYRDLALMKDTADRKLEAKEKAAYDNWKDSEESRALDKQMCDCLDAENKTKEHEAK